MGEKFISNSKIQFKWKKHFPFKIPLIQSQCHTNIGIVPKQPIYLNFAVFTFVPIWAPLQVMMNYLIVYLFIDVFI
jgi:hypothetical protein